MPDSIAPPASRRRRNALAFFRASRAAAAASAAACSSASTRSSSWYTSSVGPGGGAPACPGRERFCLSLCPAHAVAAREFSLRVSWYAGRLRHAPAGASGAPFWSSQYTSSPPSSAFAEPEAEAAAAAAAPRMLRPRFEPPAPTGFAPTVPATPPPTTPRGAAPRVLRLRRAARASAPVPEPPRGGLRELAGVILDAVRAVFRLPLLAAHHAVLELRELVLEPVARMRAHYDAAVVRLGGFPVRALHLQERRVRLVEQRVSLPDIVRLQELEDVVRLLAEVRVLHPDAQEPRVVAVLLEPRLAQLARAPLQQRQHLGLAPAGGERLLGPLDEAHPDLQGVIARVRRERLPKSAMVSGEAGRGAVSGGGKRKRRSRVHGFTRPRPKPPVVVVGFANRRSQPRRARTSAPP